MYLQCDCFCKRFKPLHSLSKHLPALQLSADSWMNYTDFCLVNL